MEEEKHYSAANEGEEESGWTSYFQDFCGDEKENDERDQVSLSCSSSSMVSDASSLPTPPASAAAWNNSPQKLPVHHHQQNGYSGTVLLKKLSFKKRSSRGRADNNIIPAAGGGQYCYHDDSLEDTASSPVSSPKVYDLRKMEINSRRKTTPNDSNSNRNPFGSISLGNINGRGSSCLEQEQKMMDFNSNSNSKNDDECTELKKKGLCLVPLSMLLHYLG